jgi:hypothetical protein
MAKFIRQEHLNAEAIMRKISGAVSVLSLAAALLGVQTMPASADVVVNNIFSPFTSIQVGPGPRTYGYGSSTWWVHNPHHHQRCYRRWDPYFGEWQWRCVRMHYRGGPYWD